LLAAANKNFYGQINGRDSLRDIETSLKRQSSKWYQIRLKDIKRCTLSDANYSTVGVYMSSCFIG